MLNLTPFLLFDGNCAEAMEFYQSCLGGKLHVIKLGDTPMAKQAPPEQHQKITYARLTSGAIEFSATDWLHPTRSPQRGNMVALYINGATYDELREVFDKLAAGADPSLLDDLRTMPFGIYGHLVDRFGVSWFFQSQATTG